MTSLKPVQDWDNLRLLSDNLICSDVLKFGQVEHMERHGGALFKLSAVAELTLWKGTKLG